MEVHHHSHTERKKWTHYFWEFLMLFLAVFFGFLAEYQLEHTIEHQREKQYISSLISDLKTDTVNITKLLTSYNSIQKSCDTVIENFDSFKGHFTKLTGRNFFLNIEAGYPDFIYTDRTIQQLKNSGGMRLIRNSAAADSIIAYDAAVRDIIGEETEITLHIHKIKDLTYEILSYRILSSAFKTKSPDEIEKEKINFWINQGNEQFEHLFNLIFKYKEAIIYFKIFLTRLKKKGNDLIIYLQKEYHLK